MTGTEKRILIVEDDQAIRETLAELLMGEGYNVFTARDGEEGLETLRATQHPHLILLDLMMPRKDGTQFRREQLEDPKLSQIPVLIMSADAQLQAKAATLGNVSAIKKPLDIDQLLEMITTHIS